MGDTLEGSAERSASKRTAHSTYHPCDGMGLSPRGLRLPSYMLLTFVRHTNEGVRVRIGNTGHRSLIRERYKVKYLRVRTWKKLRVVSGECGRLT